MQHYDVIVVGLGVMGGAAVYHCAKRGSRVLGLEANAQGHSFGSSHGSTRAIREAYFESPDYVPLIQRAYDLWGQLGRDARQDLLTTSGAVYLGPAGNKLTHGIALASEAHDLEYEQLSRKQIAQRYSGFAVPGGWDVVFEKRGGILQTDACQRAHLKLAETLGAEIRFETPVTRWRRDNGRIVIETPDQQYIANKLILTLGPWACDAFSETGIPFSARRVVMVHLEPENAALFSHKSMSVFFWVTPEGIYGGFPYFKKDGIRIARHDHGVECTPSTVNREIEAEDIDQIKRLADKYMPSAHKSVREANVCLYTMTPDNHFVIDRHPTIPNVVIAGGFSGHGFKFAPVVGEILADLTLDEGTDHSIEFLSAGRFLDAPAVNSAAQ